MRWSWTASIMALAAAAQCHGGVLPHDVQSLAKRSEDQPLPTKLNLISTKQMAQLNLMPNVLKDVSFDCALPANATLWNCKLTFFWFDPNAVAENNITSTNCTYTTTWTGATATVASQSAVAANSPYQTCFVNLPTFFEVNLATFDGLGGLVLQLGHAFKDSADFPPPWEYPTMYAEPIVLLNSTKNATDAKSWYGSGPYFATITQIAD